MLLYILPNTYRAWVVMQKMKLIHLTFWVSNLYNHNLLTESSLPLPNEAKLHQREKILSGLLRAHLFCILRYNIAANSCSEYWGQCRCTVILLHLSWRALLIHRHPSETGTCSFSLHSNFPREWIANNLAACTAANIY